MNGGVDCPIADSIVWNELGEIWSVLLQPNAISVATTITIKETNSPIEKINENSCNLSINNHLDNSNENGTLKSDNFFRKET
jgi:hypothetical protein